MTVSVSIDISGVDLDDSIIIDRSFHDFLNDFFDNAFNRDFNNVFNIDGFLDDFLDWDFHDPFVGNFYDLFVGNFHKNFSYDFLFNDLFNWFFDNDIVRDFNFLVDWDGFFLDNLNFDFNNFF